MFTLQKALCWMSIFSIACSSLAVSICPSGSDDTSAIQTAMTNLNSGETLYFNAGTYLISGTLKLYQDNVTISFLDGAKLQVIGNGFPEAFTCCGNNVIFNDFNFEGNNKCSLGLQLYKCTNITINRPVIKNIYGDWGAEVRGAVAIKLRTASNVDILYGTITNIIASTVPAAGILCTTGDNPIGKYSGISIKGCIISNVKANMDSDGISFLSGTLADHDVESSIEDCEFYNCYKRAIKLQADNINITNVIIVNDFIDETIICSYLIDFQTADNCILDGANIFFTGSNDAAIGLGGNNNVIKNVNIHLTRKSMDSNGTYPWDVWAIRNQGWSLDGLELKNINIYGDFKHAVRIADWPPDVNYSNITLDNIYSQKQLLLNVTNGNGFTVKNSTFGSYYYGRAAVSQSNSLTAELKPIIHYKMDEISGTLIDASNNNNNSSGEVNLLYSQTGTFHDSIEFDGSSSYVKIPSSPSLDAINHHITIATWIKPNVDGQRCIVNKKWDGTYSGFDFRTGVSGKIFFRIGDGIKNVTAYSEANAFITGIWQHFAVVYNGKEVKFYVNGIEKGSSVMTGRIASNTLPVYIGKHPNNVYYFDGMLDDFKIYNRSLTSYQLKETAYMSAHYRLDGNGTDETGYSNATINGSPTTVPMKVDTGLYLYSPDQYLEADNNSALNLGTLGSEPNSGLTISSWINPDSIGFDKTIVNKGWESAASGYELRAYGKTLRLWINGHFAQSALILNYGTIQHVTATYDGSYARFYVNGVLRSTKELVAGNPINNSNKLNIGIYTNKSSHHFNGIIDDLRLFKYVLTQEDIFELFSEGWDQI